MTMKKKFLRFILLIFCALAMIALLSACQKEVTFEDIVIEGEDVSGLQEGVYTLRYTIKNLEQYQKKHSASVNVIVTDQNNNVVELENQRTLKIKKDYVYLVTITVMSGDKVKTHNYTVTAIKSPITVTFTSIYNNFKDIIKVVPYGGTLTDIPEVPDYQPEEQAGYTTTVIKVGWDRADFTNLKSHIKVYAVYNITSERNLYRVIYHTDGGSEIPPRQYYYEEYLEEPEEPQKEGCVFFGWYKDKELKERFSFNKAQIGAENIDLYARWLQPVENPTSPDYFDFVLINNGKSYSISAKENIPMPETLILPSVYNGKPVTKIGKFSELANIKEVYLPESVTEIQPAAFSAQPLLGDGPAQTELERVFIHERAELTSIPEKAFAYCDKLRSINIPSGVLSIDKQAFLECSSLNEVLFEDDSKLKYIYEEAFQNCLSLEQISLGENMTALYGKAFYNCHALTEVTILALTPPSMAANCFYYNNGGQDQIIPSLTFYVPQQSLQDYKNNNSFKPFDNITALPD
jgi:hypothetical protein